MDSSTCHSTTAILADSCCGTAGITLLCSGKQLLCVGWPSRFKSRAVLFGVNRRGAVMRESSQNQDTFQVAKFFLNLSRSISPLTRLHLLPD